MPAAATAAPPRMRAIGPARPGLPASPPEDGCGSAHSRSDLQRPSRFTIRSSAWRESWVISRICCSARAAAAAVPPFPVAEHYGSRVCGQEMKREGPSADPGYACYRIAQEDCTVSDLIHDPPWTNGPPDCEECPSHPGEAKPCGICRDEQDAEGHEIITFGFITSAAAERAILDLYAEQCGQANELARDAQP